jgi:hypothetical protein
MGKRIVLGALLLAAFGVASVRAESSGETRAADAGADVEVKALVRGVLDAEVRKCIERSGGRVLSETRGVGVLLVRIPVGGVIELAGLEQVRSIRLLGAPDGSRARLARAIRTEDAASDIGGTVASAARLSALAAGGGSGSITAPAGMPIPEVGPHADQRGPHAPPPTAPTPATIPMMGTPR